MRDTGTSYWTLTQARAWVVFRDDRVVTKFAPPNPESWSAFMIYDTMRSEYPEKGKASDLYNALESGRLKAVGRKNRPNSVQQEIPSAEWLSLIPNSDRPYRRSRHAEKEYPWLDIWVQSADLKLLWRGTSEISARTRYDWNAFKAIYDKVCKRNPNFSQNELISESQQEFEARFNKSAPARSTIQDKIKTWT